MSNDNGVIHLPTLTTIEATEKPLNVCDDSISDESESPLYQQNADDLYSQYQYYADNFSMLFEDDYYENQPDDVACSYNDESPESSRNEYNLTQVHEHLSHEKSERKSLNDAITPIRMPEKERLTANKIAIPLAITKCLGLVSPSLPTTCCARKAELPKYEFIYIEDTCHVVEPKPIPWLSDAFRKFKHRIKVKESDMIDGRYLDSDFFYNNIKKLLYKINFVVIRSGLGTGKTQLVAALINVYFDACGIAICHREALTKELAKRMNATCYQDTNNIFDSQLLASTIHSYLKVIAQALDEVLNGVFLIDESESVGGEFCSDVFKNEAKTLAAMREAVKRHKLTILTDAHAGEATLELLTKLGGNGNNTLVFDAQYQELKGYTVELVSGKDQSRGCSTKTLWMDEVTRHYENDRRVFAPALSSDAGTDLKNHLVRKYPDIKVILVTSETKESDTVKNLNADTYGEYDVIIISPTMSTGISFDKNNCHVCCAYMPNNVGTGTPFDGLQSIMRDRGLLHRRIQIFYSCNSNPLTYSQTRDLERYKCRENQADYFNSLSDDEKARYLKAHPQFDDVTDLQDKIDGIHANLKAYFKPTLIKHLRHKGARVVEIDVDDWRRKVVVTKEVMKQMRHEKNEANFLAVANSEKISSADYVELDKQKGGDAPATPENARARDINQYQSISPTQAKKTRHRIERAFCTHFERLQPQEIRYLHDKYADGYTQQLALTELIFSKKKAIKAIQDAAFLGIGNYLNDELAFVEKSWLNDKYSWGKKQKIGKKLYSMLGVSLEDNQLVITHSPNLVDGDDMKNPRNPLHSYFKLVQTSKELLIESGFISASHYKTAISELTRPEVLAKLFVESIGKLGIKAYKSRGKPCYLIDDQSLSEMIGYVNKRKLSKQNVIDYRVEKINSYIESDKMAKAETEHSKLLSLQRRTKAQEHETNTAIINQMKKQVNQKIREVQQGLSDVDITMLLDARVLLNQGRIPANLQLAA